MAKIMAVDDALVMRRLIKVALESDGHDVLVFEDGVKALKFAQKEEVDLVISDVYMPHMKGTTLVRRLRQLPAYENIPILMLSTESSDVVKQQARSFGADGWVQKPLVAERLQIGVQKMLSKFGKPH